MDLNRETIQMVIVATGIVVFCHRNDCRWVMYVLAVIAALWKKASDRVRAVDAGKAD